MYSIKNDIVNINKPKIRLDFDFFFIISIIESSKIAKNKMYATQYQFNNIIVALSIKSSELRKSLAFRNGKYL